MQALLSEPAALAPIFLTSPTMITAVILIMSKSGGKRRAAAALLGSALTVLFLAVLALTLGGVLGGAVQSGRYKEEIKAVNLFLGLLLIGFGIKRLVGGRNHASSPKVKSEKPKPQAETPKKRGGFVVGFLVTIANPTSMAAYFTLAKDAVVSGVDLTSQAVIMAAGGFLFVCPILLPLLLAVFAPSASDRVLATLDRWMKKYSDVIALTLFFIFGVYLTAKGLGLLG